MKRRILYRGPDVFSEREQYWQRQQQVTGMKPRANDIQRRDEREVAEHEAAHAVAALATGGSVGEIRLGADLDGSAAGEFRARTDSRSSPLDPATEDKVYNDLCSTLRGSDARWALDQLTVKLAPLAFELGAGRDRARESCRSDIERARTMAAAVTADELATGRLLDRALMRAAGIVDRHRYHIRALGAELVRHRRMIGTEVASFLTTRGFSTVPQRVDVIGGPAIAAVRQLRGGGDRVPSHPRPWCEVFGA
jgi:hypothetical protein